MLLAVFSMDAMAATILLVYVKKEKTAL